MRASETPRICLIAHNAYGAMTGGSHGHVGGVERQTSITACWLASRGYEVSLLTWNEGQPPEVMIDGVRVISICKQSKGLPGIRFVHPRMTGLFAAMRQADADVYYHNCAEYVTGLIAWWCRRHNRYFVYSSAHDYHCDARLPALPKSYERVLYRYGLYRADRIIVQTTFQQRLLKKSFGLDSIPLPMPCPGPESNAFAPRKMPSDKRVVWVGRAVPEKRLDRLLDIAARTPEVTFDVAAANITNTTYVQNIVERARSLSNVNWLGFVPRERMPELYKRSLCLCSTSDREGFPNTFLEAWSWGTPILTTFDPDGLVAAHKLGAVVADASQASEAIRGLLANPDHWEELSRNVRNYYERSHDIDSAVARFEGIFQSAWKAKW